MALEAILQDFVETGEKAVLKASSDLMSYYNPGGFEGEVRDKAVDSEVTPADLASNTILVEQMREFQSQYGNVAIYSEETGLVGDENAEYLIFIDPLDGTKDFIEGTGNFCIILGLTQRIDGKYERVADVVYLPVLNEMYTAIKGNGAFKKVGEEKPERLYVSEVDNLEQAVSVTSRFHSDSHVGQALDAMGIAENNRQQRGSAGCKLCYLSQGGNLEDGADLYVHNSQRPLGPYDIPETIFTEAGGVLTDMKGDPLIYDVSNPVLENGVLATNNYLHSQAVEVTRDIINL